MKTSELQNSIIRKILDTKDKSLLDYVDSILSQKKTDLYKLSDFEKSVVNESIAEYKRGNVVSNEDVFARNKKWLEE